MACGRSHSKFRNDRLHGRLRFHEKGSKVIWKPVPDELRSLLEAAIADGAIVEGDVHALRAAFAVFYLERHPGDVEALKELMGHRSIATTQVYLRKLDRQRAMERVRDLSWGVAMTDESEESVHPQIAEERFASSPAVGAGGFEPP